MEKGEWSDQMEKNMLGNIEMIKNMALENLYGGMEGNIKESGLMGNSMEKGFMLMLMGVGEQGSGILERMLDGLLSKMNKIDVKLFIYNELIIYLN